MIHLVHGEQCQLDALSETPLLGALGNNFLFMLTPSPRSKLAKQNAFCSAFKTSKTEIYDALRSTNFLVSDLKWIPTHVASGVRKKN